MTDEQKDEPGFGSPSGLRQRLRGASMRTSWSLHELFTRFMARLGLGEEDCPAEPEVRETLLPRIVEPPPRSSSTARLALLLSLAAVAAVVYLHVPAIRDAIYSVAGIGTPAPRPAGRPRVEQTSPKFDVHRVMLEDIFYSKTAAAAVLDWAGVLNPKLTTAQRIDESDRLQHVLREELRQEVSGHPEISKHLTSAEASRFRLSHCCTAGEARNPHLIACLSADELPEDLIFAVRRSGPAYEVRRVGIGSKQRQQAGETGSVTPSAEDFDGDSVQELVLVYRTEDPFVGITVYRLKGQGPGARFLPVMEHWLEDYGSIEFIRQPRRLPRLRVMEGSGGEYTIDPQLCREYAWNGEAIVLHRQYYLSTED